MQGSWVHVPRETDFISRILKKKKSVRKHWVSYISLNSASHFLTNFKGRRWVKRMTKTKYRNEDNTVRGGMWGGMILFWISYIYIYVYIICLYHMIYIYVYISIYLSIHLSIYLSINTKYVLPNSRKVLNVLNWLEGA